jgi:hypothetical protein
MIELAFGRTAATGPGRDILSSAKKLQCLRITAPLKEMRKLRMQQIGLFADDLIENAHLVGDDGPISGFDPSHERN